jgi:hypothetical protein
MDIFRCGPCPLWAINDQTHRSKRHKKKDRQLRRSLGNLVRCFSQAPSLAFRFQAEGGGKEWQDGWGRGNSWNLKMGATLRCKHGAGKKFYATFTPDRG